MASPAYTINDRRGQSSGWAGDEMIRASRQTYDRRVIQNLGNDFHRNVSAFGRRTLMTLGRWLFWNFPALRGAILEQANLAVSTFLPQYKGRNKAWGEQAEAWLNDWHRIMDVSGWPYDYNTYVQHLIVSPLIDGDVATLLTEGNDGYPFIQVIPAHRIDCNEEKVSTGPYVGMKVVDGLIVDDYGRVVAHRLIAGEGYRDVPASDIFLTFTPDQPGQLRGVSGVASAAFDWMDTAEIRKFELLAQKAFSSQTIIEHNEAGEADPTFEIVSGNAQFNADGTKSTPSVQTLDGGTYRYFKAGTGSKLEAFDWNRPNQNSREFMETIVRDAFRGAEMDAFFSLDPKSIGGAPMRVIVERVNATLRKRRRQVEKACRRVDGWAIAKAMKRGDLPWDDDWFKWEFQGPGDITADRKYDSDVDLQEISAGIGTRKGAIARRGEYIEEVDAQRVAEVSSDLDAAKGLSDKYGISILQAMQLLRPEAKIAAPANEQQTAGANEE